MFMVRSIRLVGVGRGSIRSGCTVRPTVPGRPTGGAQILRISVPFYLVGPKIPQIPTPFSLIGILLPDILASFSLVGIHLPYIPVAFPNVFAEVFPLFLYLPFVARFLRIRQRFSVSPDLFIVTLNLSAVFLDGSRILANLAAVLPDVHRVLFHLRPFFLGYDSGVIREMHISFFVYPSVCPLGIGSLGAE
jgi:hypothetical protein